jgi:hypothetical protein
MHIKGKSGRTALDWAILCKHPAVEAVLRAHFTKLEAEAEAAGK